MRNNKGFTLVELLVTLAVLAVIMGEVATLMINTSTLYSNGTREVSLQTEAQLVIQQLEDLMIDADWAVTHVYNETEQRDDLITISVNQTSGLTYKISYVPSSVPSVSYGSLYLTQIGGEDPCTDLLLADYVQSVSLDMTNFATNDVVTINLVLSNGKYTYEASQDIFLRNMIGSGRSSRGTAHTSVSEKETELDRFEVMSLDSQFYSDIYNFEKDNGTGYTYSYKWQDETKGVRTPASVYLLDDFNNTVECQAYINKYENFKKSYPDASQDPECIIICVATDAAGNEKEVSKISLVTPAVGVGLGLGSTEDGKTATSEFGYGLVFPSAANSSEFANAVGIQGIDPGYCTEIKYEYTLEKFNMPVDIASLDGLGDDDVDMVIDAISYDKTFAAYDYRISGWISDYDENAAGSWLTDSAANGNSFSKKNVTGVLGYGHARDALSNRLLYEIMGVDASTYQLNNLGFASDSSGNCLLVYPDRMNNGNVSDYYKLIRSGYLLTCHITMVYPGNNNLEFDLFFMPNISSNTDNNGVSDTYLKNSMKVFYKMLTKLPKRVVTS